MQNTSILYRVIFCVDIFKDYVYFSGFLSSQKATAIILLHNRFTKIQIKNLKEDESKKHAFGHELCLTCA